MVSVANRRTRKDGYEWRNNATTSDGWPVRAASNCRRCRSWHGEAGTPYSVVANILTVVLSMPYPVIAYVPTYLNLSAHRFYNRWNHVGGDYIFCPRSAVWFTGHIASQKGSDCYLIRLTKLEYAWINSKWTVLPCLTPTSLWRKPLKRQDKTSQANIVLFPSQIIITLNQFLDYRTLSISTYKITKKRSRSVECIDHIKHPVPIRIHPSVMMVSLPAFLILLVQNRHNSSPLQISILNLLRPRQRKTCKHTKRVWSDTVNTQRTSPNQLFVSAVKDPPCCRSSHWGVPWQGFFSVCNYRFEALILHWRQGVFESSTKPSLASLMINSICFWSVVLRHMPLAWKLIYVNW